MKYVQDILPDPGACSVHDVGCGVPGVRILHVFIYEK